MSEKERIEIEMVRLVRERDELKQSLRNVESNIALLHRLLSAEGKGPYFDTIQPPTEEELKAGRTKDGFACGTAERIE